MSGTRFKYGSPDALDCSPLMMKAPPRATSAELAQPRLIGVRRGSSHGKVRDFRLRALDDYRFLSLAFGALERARVETQPDRLDADDPHRPLALGAHSCPDGFGRVGGKGCKRHSALLAVAGGSATGLSAIGAWSRKPMIGLGCGPINIRRINLR